MSGDSLAAMSVARRAQIWERILAARRSTTLVGEIGGELVAFASYGAARDADRDRRADAELYALYAAPSWWSHGCGYDLWSHMEAELRTSGRERVSLWVLEGNDRARRFYERQGCLLDRGVRKVWHPRSEALPEVRYSKPLGAGD